MQDFIELSHLFVQTEEVMYPCPNSKDLYNTLHTYPTRDIMKKLSSKTIQKIFDLRKKV